MAIFKKIPKYTLLSVKRKEIPDGLWSKCPGCNKALFNKTLEDNFRVCPHCEYHFSLNVWERIALLIDDGTFKEWDEKLQTKDVLNFQGPKSYVDKIEADKEKTGLKEAVVTGLGRMHSRKVALGVTDSRFIMGSMGSVVGEKITRMIEQAMELKLPVVMVSGSGGGARMYEGMLSLSQMAKTSGALSALSKAGLPYISVLTHPTMAGVMASFAGLGDVMIAEPQALIGFTGPRVIEQTIREKLPPGFQKSEFMLEHGLIDMVVHRKILKKTLVDILGYLT